MSRLADQIQQVLPVFSELETPPALMNGLALAAHKVIRATRDVDFLVAAVDADRVHGLLLTLGYRFSTGRRRYLDFHRENLRLEARPSMQHLEQHENDELRFAGGG